MIEVRAGGTYVGPAYNYIPLPLLGQTGYTDVIFCPWCRDLYIQATVAGLGSGEEITLTAEGSLDGTNWDNLNATDATVTIDTNGVTLIYYADALPPYVRVGIVGAAGVLATATIGIKGYIQSIS